MDPTELAAKTVAHYEADDTLLHNETPKPGTDCELCDWMEDATVSLSGMIAEVQMLRTALRQVAQAHAWLAFGECRSFGADVTLLSASDADAVARVALGEYRAGPNVRVKPAPTVGRQARDAENVRRTCIPGLVARRWGSA